MARTIGRKYKNLIIKLVADARKQGLEGFGIADYVTKHMPAEAYETWEMAFQEIERLTDDYVFAEVNE